MWKENNGQQKQNKKKRLLTLHIFFVHKKIDVSFLLWTIQGLKTILYNRICV